MNKNYYVLTKAGQDRFRTWLIKHDLSMTKFAAKCGVSKQYIQQAASGKIHITKSVRETFSRGGYELL